MATVLWRNRDWAVTDYGLESLVPIFEYPIPKERLCELFPGASHISVWPRHMAEKSWVQFDLFCSAYVKALEIHAPKDRDKIDLAASLARPEANRYRRKTGRLAEHGTRSPAEYPSRLPADMDKN